MREGGSQASQVHCLVFEAFEKPLFLPSVDLNHVVIVTSVVAVA